MVGSGMDHHRDQSAVPAGLVARKSAGVYLLRPAVVHLSPLPVFQPFLRVVCCFLSLHLFGAHYTYAETPFGFWLQDWFGFERNHYDRIVHFTFGLLLAFPMREILLRQSGLNRAWSYFISINCILAFSAVYEVIEMVAAIIVSPELGAAYLGTQGDEWDAQKDAALAFGGAIVAMGVTWGLVRQRSLGS